MDLSSDPDNKQHRGNLRDRLQFGVAVAQIICIMRTSSTNPSTNATKPVLLLSKVDRAKRRIAKLDERQVTLSAARKEADKELEDAKRRETIAAGQAEFVRAVEELDLTTREAVVSNVLESVKDEPRIGRIQTWVSLITPPHSRVDHTQERDQTKVSADVQSAPPNAQPQAN